jgi:hypothetical protein
MARAPHDLADLRLAPVALALDEQIEAYSGLDAAELLRRVSLETNREPRTADERRSCLIESVTRFIDLHGWEVSWDPRGLEIRHGDHRLVLGVSEDLRSFIS